MTDKAVEVLKGLEWSGTAAGQGAHMGDTNVTHYPCCPVCGGMKRGGGAEGEFNSDAFGHRRSCALRAALVQRADREVGEEDVGED